MSTVFLRTGTTRSWRCALCMAAAIAIISAGVGHARADVAWITEVWLEPSTVTNSLNQTVTIPRLIEVTTSQTQSVMELVIINATTSPFDYGYIQAVISLPAGQQVRVAAESALPDHILADQIASPGTLFELSTTLPLSLARSMLLYDQPTGLAGFVGKIQNAGALLAGLEPVDVLTFGPGGIAQPFATVTSSSWPGVINRSLGNVIFRPVDTMTFTPQSNAAVIGQQNQFALPIGGEMIYPLNPNFPNLPGIMVGSDVPEPNTAAALVGLAGLIIARRRNSM